MTDADQEKKRTGQKGQGNEEKSKQTQAEKKRPAARAGQTEAPSPAGKSGGNQTPPAPQRAEGGKRETDDPAARLKEEKERAEAAQKQLKEAQEQLKKQKDLFLRTAAEYDNYRKRTERERAALYSDATAAAVLEFLPVADNLERALQQKDCSAEDLRKGVEMVLTQLEGALKKLGVTQMGKEGEPFDPALHNAVSHVEDESAGENTVTQVFQKGYCIGDKVVRHAMVQVAN